MSGNLVDRTNNEYIQSPIDDIESFIWVTLFAKLNNSIIAPSPKEKMWAEDFESDKREETLRNFGSGGSIPGRHESLVREMEFGA